MSTHVTVQAPALERYLEGMFIAAGVAPEAASLTAQGLVRADMEGTGSHGALQAPNYLRRILAGTLSRGGTLRDIHTSGAVAVVDGGLALGQALGGQVMERASALAAQFGIGAVAVRAATHFGVAGHYAARAPQMGQIGIVLCNTRPMMPAPGGATPVVGNNPLAIAVPVAGQPPVVFDMAMSAAAMGRIRQAAARGTPIPPGWAVDATGHDTTDPGAALAGMLLPAAGPKGFGLALMVDFLCALAGGANGSAVQSMYGDPAAPAEVSWLFLALDPSHFGLDEPYAERTAHLVESLRAATARLPGDRARQNIEQAGGQVRLSADVLKALEAISTQINGPALER